VDATIAILPSAVVDQIAAGEVIERPASVVKELVDNALDAGAQTIAIETHAGGRARIRVVDDGHGMSAGDALLALERHATSKLRAVDDLWTLATLGFRGEALPSIASVSRMTLTTRRACDLVATRIVLEGARVASVAEVGAPVGTSVEVVDLFWNVPARLKFLKGEGTEAAHVGELVARVAMAHYDVHVRLRHDTRLALELPAALDRHARALALLGPRVAARMIASHGEENGVRVECLIGAPELAQTTARGVHLFVGKRPVRDRGLLHAIAMGYGELVPRGRYPVAVIHVDVPGRSVDINVHPQKLEVRFADANAVHAAVRHVVATAVARAPWRDEHANAPLVMTAIAGVAPPALPLGAPASALAVRDAVDRVQARLSLNASESARGWVARVKANLRERAHEEGEDARPSPSTLLAEGSSPNATPGYFASLRYLGQVDLTYLACEGDGELVLIDQHVAHERVELARLRDCDVVRDIAVQRMLFATTLDVAPELVAVAERDAAVLARVGFETEAFGKTTLAIKTVPARLRHADPAELLRALLASWVKAGAPSEDQRVEHVLAEIACHSVVRAGDRLAPSEAETLLRGLDAARDAPRGVHARPVLLRLPLAEIAKRFGR
jgi:DNA mismatch repair protein MutL